MTDLKERMLAAVRKGLSASPDISETKKQLLPCNRVDSTRENDVTAPASGYTAFSNEIKVVTPLQAISANSYSEPANRPYGNVLDALRARCPDHVEPKRWAQTVVDSEAFVAQWGEQARALEWSSRDLFGLHTPPPNPAPSYNRLSRYDCTGLVWLLQGCSITALSSETAVIRSPSGALTRYRKTNKPAFGPLGDSLEDFE
jgi:hypothetical protein